MSQASLLSPTYPRPAMPSGLARTLAQLLDANTQVSHQRFIARLGQHFDLADSIRISAVHEGFSDTAAQPAEADKAAIKAEYARVRAAITSSAVQAFVPGAESLRLRFPEIAADKEGADDIAPEPYLAFYVAQQRNIDFRVRDLHTSTRAALAELSPALAGLAALDAAVAEPFTATARRAFAAVPRLLRQRFEILRAAQQANGEDQPDGRARCAHIHEQFRLEMQSVLLAEIDTRLLPTQGLIEALDENND